jgi:hypothetical protein
MLQPIAGAVWLLGRLNPDGGLFLRTFKPGSMYVERSVSKDVVIGL